MPKSESKRRNSPPQPEKPYFLVNYKDGYGLSLDILKDAYREAKVRMDNQYEAYLHITRSSSMLLGWLVAALVALSGAVVSLWGGGSFRLILAGYGFVALLIPAAILAFGVNVGQRGPYDPGRMPSSYFEPPVWDAVTDISGETQERWMLLTLLGKYEIMLSLNNREQLRRIRCYRLAVVLVLAALAGGAALLLILG